MNKLSQWLKITCEDTSPLISESMDHTMPLTKRMRLWAHLAICGMCKNCMAQMNTIRSLARSLGNEGIESKSAEGLSMEAKEKIKQAMKSPNV
ncbi:MAG: hypothetical protein ACQ9MH_03520 [Nitrospinales bacterium]